MRIRTWLGHIVRLLELRRAPVVLWRLEDWRGVAEARCLCSEPAPGHFRVVVLCEGAPQVERAITGIDSLMHWSDELRRQLETNGWRGIDDLSGRGGRPRRRMGAPTQGEPVDARTGHQRTQR